MNKLSVEYQYQFYLKKMNLNEVGMHPVQRIQLKQTFYGAFGILLELMTSEIASLPEEEAIDVFTNQKKEVSDYFLNEVKNQN